MGCGSAALLGVTTPAGMLAVALCFGLSVVAMAYAIGPVSGCHINPAVSLAMLLRKKLGIWDFFGYVIAQLLGAIAGAGLLKLVCDQTGDLTGALGANGFGPLDMYGVFVVEVVLTFIFILVILFATSEKNNVSVAGVVIGLTLTLVHIVGIPLTGTSVNPARSIGPAVVAGGEALKQVWLFIVAPLAGAVIACMTFRLLRPKKA